MAVKGILTRSVTWICKDCADTNVSTATKASTNQTTMTAERHADERGHRVVAIGQIVYAIGPGATETEDPFAPRTEIGG